jgi:hypothetical protein
LFVNVAFRSCGGRLWEQRSSSLPRAALRFSRLKVASAKEGFLDPKDALREVVAFTKRMDDWVQQMNAMQRRDQMITYYPPNYALLGTTPDPDEYRHHRRPQTVTIQKSNVSGSGILRMT